MQGQFTRGFLFADTRESAQIVQTDLYRGFLHSPFGFSAMRAIVRSNMALGFVEEADPVGDKAPFTKRCAFQRLVERRLTATAQAVARMAAGMGIDMPIAHAVSGLVTHRVSVENLMQQLLNRPLKEE